MVKVELHAERNHQGKGNVLLFPRMQTPAATGLFNAASDWAAYYVITIRRQRNDVPQMSAQTETKAETMRIRDVRQGVCTENSDSHVLVMQSAEERM